MLGVHAVVVTPAPTTTTKTTSATRPPRLPHEAVQGTLLRSGQIPGLDYRTLERLIANGIRTYRSLVDLASLTLARRAGLPYTKLLDLRYHAKHFLALRLFPKGMPAPAPVESAGFEQREIVLVPPPRVDRATLRSPSARTDRSYLIPPSPEVSVRSEDSTVPGVAGPFV
jgi:hypothetical protein